MPSERPLSTPNQTSPIADAIQFGAVWPTYTWRKGGTEDPNDNHLYLTIGSADELLVPAEDALIEIDPETRFVKFWGTTEIVNGISFGENSIHGKCLIDGTVTSNKLVPGIVIDGSITKLTTARNINGINFDGTANVVNFAIVNTAGNVGRKTATITNFQPTLGAFVTLKFTNSNTASNPTLNINESDDYPINYNGSAIKGDLLTNHRIYSFVFDGTGYNLIGDLASDNTDEFVTTELVDNNTNYNLVLTNNNQTSTSHVQFATNVSYNPYQRVLTVASINSAINGSWTQIHNQRGSIINSISNGAVVGLITYKNSQGLFSITGTSNALTASFTTTDDLDGDVATHVVNILDVDGNASFPNNVKATKFEGTATSAEKAISDGEGNNIATTYATKKDLASGYLPITGGTLTGPLKLVQVQTETNVTASTVGYVDDQIAKSAEQIKQDIIGTAGDFSTIEELTTQITENTNNITQLQQQSSNFVRFDQTQTIQPNQQSIARNNIGAFSASGGIVNGDMAITGDFTSTSSLHVRNPNVTVDQTPSTAQKSSIVITDKNNTNEVGGVNVTVNKDNSTTTELFAKTNSLTGKYKTISITSKPDGSASTYAPSPASNSSDTSIATTEWVNNAISNALIGQQTINHKLYQSVLAPSTHTTLEQGLGYFSQIEPNNVLESWQASYVVKITVPYSDYNAIALLELVGIGQQYSYRYTIAHNSADVISFDGITFRPATTSSLTSGKGHYLGLSLYHSTNPDVSGYERDIDVTVIKQDNCVATLLNDITFSSTISDIDTTHDVGDNVITLDTGFYSRSNIQYGDRLTAWDRVPVAGDSAIIGNSLVAETTSGDLFSIYANGKFTTTSFDPSTIVYYTGNDLQANKTGTVLGTLYNVHKFDTKQLGNASSLNAGSRVYLFGTMDTKLWLFKAIKFKTTPDEQGYYVLLGYAGSGTNAYLIDNHPVYYVSDGAIAQTAPVPQVTTPSSSSNDDTIATTKFVQQVATQITADSLVNPIITTDTQQDTTISIKAYPNAFDRASIPAGLDYCSSLSFYDGSETADDTHVIGWVEQNISDTEDLMMVGVVKPDQANADVVNNISVGYRKSGSQWNPVVELSQSPSTADDSTAIATTEYVQNNLSNLTGLVAYCSCATAAATVAKVGTVTKYKLAAGALVIVDFVNGNTATNPTLNINNTGAKAIKSAGAAIGKLGTNTCLMFVYTGSEYHAVGVPTNTPSFTGTLTIN